ncbi:MAG TPA: tryptophan synthase subunit alpha [Burkholderiales bacterium]|jgi:tryptophan synthase alpha chain|nr:tryptophan synthase subunit alpha [Burkholderiales bacterium]
MSRIAATFDALRAQGRKALIPFITAGDPRPAATVGLMRALVDAGADVIELGVPFSDPMADGPAIQRASERALRQGTTLAAVLDIVREFRGGNSSTPVVLMGYANPIEAMGFERFADAARDAGVDGVLVVDYPPEESATFAAALEKRGIDTIFLLAPTTTDARVGEVAKHARGYIYYVSLKGVTGASHLDVNDVSTRISNLRSHIKLPIGVGFGIRDAQTAKSVAAIADAVVIGTRLVQEIEDAPADQAAARVGALLSGIRAALDDRA